MAPLLLAGEFALFRRCSEASLQPKQVVLVDSPRFGRIIKCLIIDAKERPEQTACYRLYGLHAESTSTEALGTINPQQILGCLQIIIGKQGIRRCRGSQQDSGNHQRIQAKG